MTEPVWCVHVHGPDDIHPAVSRRAAMIEAHKHNEAMLRMIDQFDEDGLMPTAWAVPSRIADVTGPDTASQWRIEGGSIVGPEFRREKRYVAPDWSEEQKQAAEERAKLHCWCGGGVGPRTPGDEKGLGCLRNVTHWWPGRPTPRMYPPRGGDARDVFAVAWVQCDEREPFIHGAHWEKTDQGGGLITNCPGRDENGVKTPPFQNRGNL